MQITEARAKRGYLEASRVRDADECAPRAYLPWEERLAQKRCTPMSVYFVQGVDGGNIKIGTSRNPERRLYEMQTGSPLQLRIVGVIRHAVRDLEQHLHGKFRASRSHHEWFRATPDLLAYIRNLGGNPR